MFNTDQLWHWRQSKSSESIYRRKTVPTVIINISTSKCIVFLRTTVNYAVYMKSTNFNFDVINRVKGSLRIHKTWSTNKTKEGTKIHNGSSILYQLKPKTMGRKTGKQFKLVKLLNWHHLNGHLAEYSCPGRRRTRTLFLLGRTQNDDSSVNMTLDHWSCVQSLWLSAHWIRAAIFFFDTNGFSTAT